MRIPLILCERRAHAACGFRCEARSAIFGVCWLRYTEGSSISGVGGVIFGDEWHWWVYAFWFLGMAEALAGLLGGFGLHGHG